MVTLAGLEPATSPRSPDWKQGRSVPLELQRRYDPHHDLWRHRGERESWARRRLCLSGIASDRVMGAPRKSVYAKSQKRAFSNFPLKYRHNLRVRAPSRRYATYRHAHEVSE